MGSVSKCTKKKILWNEWNTVKFNGRLSEERIVQTIFNREPDKSRRLHERPRTQTARGGIGHGDPNCSGKLDKHCPWPTFMELYNTPGKGVSTLWPTRYPGRFIYVFFYNGTKILRTLENRGHLKKYLNCGAVQTVYYTLRIYYLQVFQLTNSWADITWSC